MVKLKPWQAAKKWQLENSEIPFEVLVGIYMDKGLVWASEGSFLLARQAHWDGHDMYNGEEEKNCWMVQLASGSKPFRKFLELAPVRLDFVAWQRRGEEKWHVWDWDKFEQKVK